MESLLDFHVIDKHYNSVIAIIIYINIKLLHLEISEIEFETQLIFQEQKF